jgi:hypothetical protein
VDESKESVEEFSKAFSPDETAGENWGKLDTILAKARAVAAGSSTLSRSILLTDNGLRSEVIVRGKRRGNLPRNPAFGSFGTRSRFLSKHETRTPVDHWPGDAARRVVQHPDQRPQAPAPNHPSILNHANVLAMHCEVPDGGLTVTDVARDTYQVADYECTAAESWLIAAAEQRSQPKMLLSRIRHEQMNSFGVRR